MGGFIWGNEMIFNWIWTLLLTDTRRNRPDLSAAGNVSMERKKKTAALFGWQFCWKGIFLFQLIWVSSQNIIIISNLMSVVVAIKIEQITWKTINNEYETWMWHDRLHVTTMKIENVTENTQPNWSMRWEMRVVQLGFFGCQLGETPDEPKLQHADWLPLNRLLFWRSLTFIRFNYFECQSVSVTIMGFYA